ncbi:hypothetical protein [Streptomyces pactum]|uniref:Uncharacterized protein n=1 Tax=Streptomyces pactum TaxID=68249 RepID=A0A1S6J8D6_9ACTN|nr:hypothetical protein [Streptomyces pactum]AQS68012.1 hypothetical protein B1H29_14695 [Streptomyces pactum]
MPALRRLTGARLAALNHGSVRSRTVPAGDVVVRRMRDLRDDVTAPPWRTAVADAGTGRTLPEVDPDAVRGLKFAEALPPRLAEATLAARLTDEEGARAALAEPVRSSGEQPRRERVATPGDELRRADAHPVP